MGKFTHCGKPDSDVSDALKFERMQLTHYSWFQGPHHILSLIMLHCEHQICYWNNYKKKLALKMVLYALYWTSPALKCQCDYFCNECLGHFNLFNLFNFLYLLAGSLNDLANVQKHHNCIILYMCNHSEDSLSRIAFHNWILPKVV